MTAINGSKIDNSTPTEVQTSEASRAPAADASAQGKIKTQTKIGRIFSYVEAGAKAIAAGCLLVLAAKVLANAIPLLFTAATTSKAIAVTVLGVTGSISTGAAIALPIVAIVAAVALTVLGVWLAYKAYQHFKNEAIQHAADNAAEQTKTTVVSGDPQLESPPEQL